MAAGVGAGVRIGAGARAAGGGQQAFVAALMFRRGPVSEEEARADSALRALRAYRAVACGDGGDGVGGSGRFAKFPIAAVEALVEKPRCVCACVLAGVSLFLCVSGVLLLRALLCFEVRGNIF